MIDRKTTTFVNGEGIVYDVVATEAISIEDVLMQGLKMAGYARITGEDMFFIPGRPIRDFLVMTNVFGD